MISCASSYRICLRRLYVPLVHIAMEWCVPFKSHHMKNMSHLGQRGRGWLPSSSTTSVYHMWRCMKWILSTLWIKALPVIPLLGKLCHALYVGKISSRSWSHLEGGGGVPQVSPGNPLLDYLKMIKKKNCYQKHLYPTVDSSLFANVHVLYCMFYGIIYIQH